MLYFKAIKDFEFGSNIPVIIEIKHSTYNFITHEWHVLINFFLNEADIISNIVDEQVAQYVIEKGATLPESQIDFLITEYIENPKKVTQPIYFKKINLPYNFDINQEYPIMYQSLDTLKNFLSNIIQNNPLLLSIHPESLSKIDEREFNNKIKERINAILQI